MRRGHGRRVLCALLLAITLTGCAEKAPARHDRLPDITLSSIDPGGQSLALGSLKGPAVVNLWASWCAPCKAELPLYAQFARRAGARVQVVGVDFQETSTSAARRLMRDSRVGYPVVSDPDGKLRAIGAIGLPKIVLVDAAGRIVFQEYVEIKSLAQLRSLVATHLGVSV